MTQQVPLKGSAKRSAAPREPASKDEPATKKRKKTRQKRKPKLKQKKKKDKLPKPDKSPSEEPLEGKESSDGDDNERDEALDMRMAAWSHLMVPEKVSRALDELGFHKPTPIQEQTLAAAIGGRLDIVGAAETGMWRSPLQ
jgi:ATP-dependent RNA helicase DDX47/RRP3